MNKASERIVVFVTPAQKRAIAATAKDLGLTISELIRRAVLEFGATGEPIKAASIVDRLRAPQPPDALNETLRRVARTAKPARGAPLQRTPSPGTSDKAVPPPDSLGASVMRALEEAADETRLTAQAVARVTASEAAARANSGAETKPEDAPRTIAPPARVRTHARPRTAPEATAEDDAPAGPTEEDGRFA